MTAPRCHPGMRHAGRGLCDTCHARARREGRLDEYPRVNWRATELVAAADQVRAQQPSWSWRMVAEHLDVLPKTLENAQRKVRKQARPVELLVVDFADEGEDVAA